MVDEGFKVWQRVLAQGSRITSTSLQVLFDQDLTRGYFPNPSRYRPHSWRLRETVALSSPIYALISLLLLPSISSALLAGLLLIAVMAPGFIS